MFLRFLATTFCFGQAVQPDDALPGSAIQPDETIPSYLAKYDIAVEEHWVTTDDGYILEVFRLPRPEAPVVLMQHGILASAWCWLDNSPSLAPGIQMYNEGYDVWLTNNWGNTYSKNHTTLKPDFNQKFWYFSFADLGRHDVPANIKYILARTGKEQLSYVGWSQGTSQFFVAMSDPEVKSYVEQTVNLFVALSPVTYLAHQQSTLLSLLVDMHLPEVLDAAFPYGFLDSNALDVAANILCKLTLGSICEISVDLICGDSSMDTAAAITNLTAHFPAGTSVHAFHHYAQLIQNKGFKDFDYGKKGNLKKYARLRRLTLICPASVFQQLSLLGAGTRWAIIWTLRR